MSENDQKLKKQQEEERKRIDQEKKERHDQMEKERKDAKDNFEKDQKKSQEEQKKSAARVPYKSNAGVRVLNLVAGIIFLIAPAYIILDSSIVLSTSILIFAGIVLLSGISRFFNAFYDKEIGGTKRLLRFLVSIILIGLAAVIFLFEDLGEDLLLILIAVAIALQGLGRIMVAFRHGALPGWLKMTMMILGVVSIGIAITAFGSITINTFTLEESNLIILLSAAFFLGGISRVGQGIAGYNLERKK